MRCGLVLLAVAMLCATAVPPAVADDLPVWPHEQQAMLNAADEELLTVQRKLFAARQAKDEPAINALTKQFQALQDKRRALIELTRGQLPSE